ncbi:unnamed protein product [Rhizophagus irregularis]|nr:unnamed protein product [Rhizophagus irregularis]
MTRDVKGSRFMNLNRKFQTWFEGNSIPFLELYMELAIAETSQLQQLRAEILGELDKDENNLYSEEEEENINEDENLNNKKNSA